MTCRRPAVAREHKPATMWVAVHVAHHPGSECAPRPVPDARMLRYPRVQLVPSAKRRPNHPFIANARWSAVPLFGTTATISSR
jgi:hypothetical protein